jgi:hypothetical protein
MIKYNFKVYECSFKKCDDFILQYYYMYIIRAKEKFIIKDDIDISFENDFIYNGYYYLILWFKKNKNHIISSIKTNYEIAHFLIKPEDSYVVKDVKLEELKKIIKNQYCDLKNPKYDIKNILSTVWLNVLTSNKILYHKYFIKEGYIKNTQIINEKNIKNFDLKKYIIKAPYSSASKCVTMYNKLSKNCIKEEGLIVQKINKTLKFIELKLHTFNGKIFYGNIKNTFKNNSKLTVDKNLNIITYKDKERQDLINKYKKDIINICEEIFYKMNLFTQAMKYKLLYEIKYFIEPLKLKKENFYNFFEKIKIKKLNNIKKKEKDINKIKLINDYIHFINLDSEYFINIIKKPIIYDDLYMRIDLIFPDNINYHKMSLLEIEPFACGKGYILDIKNAVDFQKIKYFPKSSQSIVFSYILQNIIINKFNILKFTSVHN